jgi:hypothetical protein
MTTATERLEQQVAKLDAEIECALDRSEANNSDAVRTLRQQRANVARHLANARDEAARELLAGAK